MGRLDLPRFVEDRIGGDPVNAGQDSLQRRVILGRQKIHFDGNLTPVEL